MKIEKTWAAGPLLDSIEQRFWEGVQTNFPRAKDPVLDQLRGVLGYVLNGDPRHPRATRGTR